jgi:hypothetical protein
MREANSVLVATLGGRCLAPLDEGANLGGDTARCFCRPAVADTLEFDELAIREGFVNCTDAVLEVGRPLSSGQ